MPKRNNRKKKNYKESESTLETIVEVPEEIGEDVEKETVAAEKNESLDDIVSNLVGNVLNQALEEVNAEAEKTENFDEIVNNFVDDVLNQALEEVNAEVDKNSIKNNRLNSPVAANVFVNRTNMRLYEQCSARLKDTNVLTGALREVRHIVNPTNSRNSEILKTAQRANKISQDILDWYESVEASRLDLESPEGMEEMTGYVFNEAFKALGNDMDLSERVMMSQEITNVMMKNFSNAAFAPDDFGDYADNYMLLHSDVLKEYLDEQMSGLSDKDFTSVMDNVQKRMGDKLKASDERAKERLYNKELAAIQRFDRIRRGLEVPTDESVSTDVLREYKKQCIDNIQNNNLADEIKSQMSDILIEAGVKEETAKEVADKSFNTLTNDMAELYDDLEKYPEHLENPRAMMDITTQIVVDFAISEISKQLPTKAERLVAGQEIADVILRNYSPVAFTNGKLDKYANYYIVNNADRVFKLFDMNSFNRMSREELPEFMKDVRRVLNKQGVKVSDNPNPTVEDENELVNNEPQNQIDIKTEEKPKLNEQPVEEPKVEPEAPAEPEAPTEPEAHEEENVPVEEEAKVEEQPVNESVVEEVQETVIDYNEKHADLMIDEELAEKTKAELSQIIRDAGVTDEERASTMAGYSLQLVEMMPEVLEQHSMGDLAMYTFDQVYESLEGPVWNAIDRINAAQNITNVLMQNYSPAAFANGEMDEYKNDYVLNSRDAFINWLNTQDFTKNEINTIVENITGISVTETNNEALENQEDEKIEDEPNINDEKEVPQEAEKIDEVATDISGDDLKQAEDDVKAEEPTLDYREKHAELMIDEELAAKTKAELSQIIRDAGVTDEERASTMAGYSLQLVEMMPEVLEQHSMGDLAMYTFDQVYESLEGPVWNAIDRINAAQNITNVLMQNYSPAAFANGEMDEYKNDYVLNSRDAFINWLNTQDFTKNEINTIVEQITGISVTETEEHAEFLRDREEELEIRADAASILAKKIEQDEWVRERDADLRRRAMFFSEGAKKILEDDLRRGQQEENIRNELYMAEKREAEQQKYEENFLRNREEELQGLVSQHGIYPEAFEYQEYDDAELDNEELDAEIANLEKQIEKEESMLPENAELFGNKLKTFNSMYGTNVNVNLFVSSVSNAWTLLNDDDAEKVNEGKKALSGLLNDTLKGAFEVEKQASYEEQRLPEYSEIIKSANELLRVSMFAFTDMYHNPDKAKLFIPTAFGGLREDELAELTKGDSLWDKDQRSNSAWKIQSKTAVDIAKKWLQEDKPYQTMIDEMEALVAANKEKSIDEKDIYNKLAAAEWLLLNNDKMMIEDPEDPLNKMPNWGNRYWKAITNAREKLGIPKHISMRELIQGNYAEMGKAASNLTYNKTQILEQVLDPEQRSVFDSMEKQKVEFTVQRRGLAAVNHNNEKKIQDLEITSFRMQIYVKECDERLLMENEPKSYNFEPVKAAEFSLNNSKNEEKKEEPKKEETKNNPPEL